MSLFGRFRQKSERAAAERLYTAIVLRAREPVFYERFGVADTVDGRFDMVVVHAFLALQRLKAEPEAVDLAQALFDRMFVDMDENLREMGVGDLVVGARVKKMAKAFYGRAAAYEQGLAADGPDLEEALHRNLYRHAEVPPHALSAMATYIRGQAVALAALDLKTLLAADEIFAPVAATGGSELDK